MGLDMYLSAKTYVNKFDYKPDPEGPIVTQKFKDMLELYPELNTGDIYGFEVGRCVCYWRKANAIHNWFVQNVQAGEDNCAEYRVSHNDLEQLRNEIKQVLDNKEKADEVLPTSTGFFFGSQEYDQWYYGDLEHTLEFINTALDTDKFQGYDFYYQASW
jgi:hypothetical protein